MLVKCHYVERVYALLLGLCILFSPLALLGSAPSHAANQEAAQQINYEAMNRDIARFSTRLKSPYLKIKDVNDILKRLEDMQSLVDSTLKDASEELESVNASLESLGPKAKGEAIEVARERYSLLKKKASLEKKIGQFKVLLLKVQALKEKFYQKQKELVTSNLFYRQLDIISLVTNAVRDVPSWPKTITTYLAKRSGLGVIAKRPWAFAGGVLIALILCTGLSALFLNFARRLRIMGESTEVWSHVFYSLAVRLPIAAFLGLLALDTWLLLGRAIEASYLFTLIGTSSFYIFLLSLLNPLEIAFIRCKELTEGYKIQTVKKMARRWKVFFLLISLLLLVELPPLHRDLSKTYIQLVQAILVPLATVFFIGSVMPCLKMIKGSFTRQVTIWLLYLAALVIVGTQWLGFRNLSKHLAMGTFGTYAFGLFIYWFKGALHHLLDDFAVGRNDWSKRLRRKIGIKEDEILKIFFWVKTIFSILLWGIWGISLFYFWSVSSTYLNRISSVFFHGFSIGKFQMVPVRLIAAVFIFMASWGITPWVKRRLEKKLKESYMTKSARDALVTLTGYSGFVIAIILSLGIAGIGFTNLAVIVGALSVGIGFGLQNIVNNFVSGLILLFERPIKRGDWIMVGQTEGYVKKISVRSTVIQTFDRSDVIVPNSELISSQVTNWMLSDVYGRLTLFVGVAYDSDVRLVEKILYQVAEAHPMVINDRPNMKPKVYFWEFGDSALNFRLDVFLKDVDKRRSVRSEINFAIDEAFRRHGITIPFPQRDIYIKEFRSHGEKED